MMLKRFSYIVIGLLVASCGASVDKRAELSDLKKQRDELNEKIILIEAQIKKEDGPVAEHATTVSVQQFTGEMFKHYIEVQGLVESDNNILIPVQSPGVVREIYVEEGAVVKKGQVLAQIDADLINRGIEELSASLELAKTVCERQDRLWKQKIGSEVQYLQARTQKVSLEKKMESLVKQLEMTKIIAPINGTVDKIIIKKGEMAGAGMGAIRVVNISDLKITAALSEAYVNDVNKGDFVSIRIPSLGMKSSEKIISVAKVINPKNRTFAFEVEAPGVKNLKPNMLTVLSVNDYTKEKAIVVPMNILQNTGKEYFVFKAVKKAGKWYAEKTSVKPGKYYNNMIELVEGVNEGDHLVTFGFQQISNGSLLKISK